jgi:hypothetical protein
MNSLSTEDHHHCSRKIPQIALILLPESPWQKLLTLQVDQAMITMTGFDCLSFQALLKKFAPLFDDYTPFNRSHIKCKANPSKGGCPRKVHPKDCLGLVLVWMHTRGLLTVLQLIFGMNNSNLHMYLRFGRRIIIEALKNNSLSKITIPGSEDIVVYQQAVGAIYPLLLDVWLYGLMDCVLFIRVE